MHDHHASRAPVLDGVTLLPLARTATRSPQALANQVGDFGQIRARDDVPAECAPPGTDTQRGRPRRLARTPQRTYPAVSNRISTARAPYRGHELGGAQTSTVPRVFSRVRSGSVDQPRRVVGTQTEVLRAWRPLLTLHVVAALQGCGVGPALTSSSLSAQVIGTPLGSELRLRR